MKQKIKILTLNTSGIRQVSKRKLIFEYISQTGADVIYLQETHSSVEIENKWTSEWRGKALWNSKSSTTAGTTILLANNRRRYTISDSTQDMKERLQQATIKIGKTMLNLTNLHGYNDRKRRKAQLRTLAARTK